MRFLFGILLLLSIGLFVLMQWGGELEGGAKNGQMLAELNPEKIILLDVPAHRPLSGSAVLPAQPAVAAVVPASAVPASAVLVPQVPAVAVSAPLPVAVPLPASAPAKTAVSAVSAVTPKPAAAKAIISPAPVAPVALQKAAARSCMEWGEFSGADLGRATKALSEMNLGERMTQHNVEYASGYWVYMPPQKNKAAVSRKIAEIKALGVADFYVVHEKPKLVNVISLGVFKTSEAAKNFLASLQKKGVRTAVVGERKLRLKFIFFEFNGIDAETAARLSRLQKEYAYSELKTVSCNSATR